MPVLPLKSKKQTNGKLGKVTKTVSNATPPTARNGTDDEDEEDEDEDANDDKEQKVDEEDDGDIANEEDEINSGVDDDVLSSKKRRTFSDRRWILIGHKLARTYQMFGSARNTLKACFHLAIRGQLWTDDEDGSLAKANYTHRLAARWMIEEYPELAEVFSCDESLAEKDLALWRKEKQRVYKAIYNVADLIEKGRTEAKANDIQAIKRELPLNFKIKNDEFPLFKNLDPEDKSEYGVHHTQLAPLMTPMGMDWNKEDDRNKLLQPGGCKISAKKWYPFMWRGRSIDYDDVADGFLLGDLLIKVFKRIWFGSAKLNGRKIDSSSIATKLGTEYVTIHMISYVATITRFVLSSEDRFAQSLFNHKLFYTHLINHLEKPEYQNLKEEVVSEWDRIMFGEEDDDLELEVEDSADLFDRCFQKRAEADAKEAQALVERQSALKEARAGKEREKSPEERQEKLAMPAGDATVKDGQVHPSTSAFQLPPLNIAVEGAEADASANKHGSTSQHDNGNGNDMKVEKTSELDSSGQTEEGGDAQMEAYDDRDDAAIVDPKKKSKLEGTTSDVEIVNILESPATKNLKRTVHEISDDESEKENTPDTTTNGKNQRGKGTNEDKRPNGARTRAAGVPLVKPLSNRGRRSNKR